MHMSFMPPVGGRASLVWPRAHQVIGPGRSRKPLEYVKYGCRLWASTTWRQQFLATLAQLPPWQAFFAAEPLHYYIPLRLYLDRRWSAQQRFTACAHDLRTALAVLGPERLQTLLAGQPLRLCAQPGFAVDLQLNRISRHEGFWALALVDGEERQLFNLSFGFSAPGTVLIASVQGTGAQATNLDAIQTLTKQTHGMRPPHLLLSVLQQVCAAWGLQQVLGIAPEHQVKRRRNTQKQGFTFDYCALWTEAGATLEADGYWHLPLAPKRRSDDDIPARKRSQYRKRYALLDALATSVNAALGIAPATLSPAEPHGA